MPKTPQPIFSIPIALNAPVEESTRQAYLRLLSPNPTLRKQAEDVFMDLITPHFLYQVRQKLVIWHVRTTDKPLSDQSILMPVPKTFGIDTFNEASVKWAKERPGQTLTTMLVGRRQMAQIRALAYKPTKRAKSAKAKVFAAAGVPQTFGIELVEKDRASWFELTAELPQ